MVVDEELEFNTNLFTTVEPGLGGGGGLIIEEQKPSAKSIQL